MTTIEVTIPDLGDATGVKVVEVLVAPGSRVEKDDGLVTLESDKATMDVPSPRAGRVTEVRLSAGDEVSAGDVVALLEVAAEQADGGDDEDEAERAVESREVGGAPAPPAGAAAPAVEVAPSAAPAGEDGQPMDADGTALGRRPPDAAPRRPSPSLPKADLQVEVAVLGAGPGGYTAAFRAADLGKRVALLERYPTLGGVCLNVGCIPSKALLHAARVLEGARDFGDHGISFGKPRIDVERLRAWKQAVVDRLTAGLADLARRRKVEVVLGTASFASPHHLRVEGEGPARLVAFDHCIVAAGSRAVRLPAFSGEDPRVLDSTSALDLEEVPRRLLVVGGGIIGLEMATIYAALGSRVTVVELLDGLMAGADRDLVRPLRKRLEGRLGVEVHVETRVATARPRRGVLEVSFEGKAAPAPALFDRVLVAVGRRPNADRIGAEEAGLEVDGRGFLGVDRQQRTNVPHIFAIGDVAGPPLLAHKATHEGKVAAEVAAGLRSSFDARGIPSVAYTDPEVAWVGLTEGEAREKGVAFRRAVFPWAASARSLGMGRDDGMTKLLFDPETGRVLGGGIVGPNAGDLVSEVTLALEMDCEAADLALTIHPHPTLSETIAFAAEAFEGTITDLYVPRQLQRSRP